MASVRAEVPQPRFPSPTSSWPGRLSQSGLLDRFPTSNRFAFLIATGPERLPDMYSGASAGPSQPEWRLPATSQQQQHPATTATTGSPALGSSSSPSPQPSLAYSPGDFGPVSGAAPVATGLDTTAWGVRHNHPQHQTHSPPPPPLPVSIWDFGLMYSKVMFAY